jgi:carnitine O-acetyltransferase
MPLPAAVLDGPPVDGPVSGIGGKTMANQDTLPHLPIPPLEDTMKRYLKALEGLQVSTL